MDKPKAFLKEWTKEYLKNKDLIRRAIISITEDKEGVDLFVEFKEKTQAFLIEPEIDNLIATLEKLNSAKTNLKASHSSIVLLNSKENLKKVIDSWSELIKDNTLSLYFINPFSETQ
ncbi:hypothetical protein KY330_00945 [Candidatus Woesearchaeota archaeon]|nr:hypothetical protein [Candidatus Woesearchaeota archaeon]